MPLGKSSSKRNLVNRLHPLHKMFIAAVVGALTFILVPLHMLTPMARTMLVWDLFAATILLLDWITFFTTPAPQIKEEAQRQDGSRVFVFVIVLITTFASFFAVLLLLLSKNNSSDTRFVEPVLAVAGMMFSWALVHTIFTVKYAHLYYSNEDVKPLDFPDDIQPDFLDFAYFSFVLGMTFQVSDVSVNNQRIRRLALLHSLLSFGYNTALVALTINIIAGLTS